jgi:hypothetical protein
LITPCELDGRIQGDLHAGRRPIQRMSPEILTELDKNIVEQKKTIVVKK